MQCIAAVRGTSGGTLRIGSDVLLVPSRAARRAGCCGGGREDRREKARRHSVSDLVSKSWYRREVCRIRIGLADSLRNPPGIMAPAVACQPSGRATTLVTRAAPVKRGSPPRSARHGVQGIQSIARRRVGVGGVGRRARCRGPRLADRRERGRWHLVDRRAVQWRRRRDARRGPGGREVCPEGPRISGGGRARVKPGEAARLGQQRASAVARAARVLGSDPQWTGAAERKLWERACRWRGERTVPGERRGAGYGGRGAAGGLGSRARAALGYPGESMPTASQLSQMLQRGEPV